jgi:hypothetical protein
MSHHKDYHIDPNMRHIIVKINSMFFTHHITTTTLTVPIYKVIIIMHDAQIMSCRYLCTLQVHPPHRYNKHRPMACNKIWWSCNKLICIQLYANDACMRLVGRYMIYWYDLVAYNHPQWYCNIYTMIKLVLSWWNMVIVGHAKETTQ